MIPLLCYGLLLVAWVIDLLTPQLFVAAILLNGPIALSTLALRPRLTIWLTITAEFANVVAGYVNGTQDGYHWSPVALGDRVLAGLSFLLVGVLTMRAQEAAHRVGEATERGRQIANERALRHAMQSVRSSLNMELVLRTATREALMLTGAEKVTVVARESTLQVPTSYHIASGDGDITVTRAPLLGHVASMLERARGCEGILTVAAQDASGRMLGGAALVAVIDPNRSETAIVVQWAAGTPATEQVQAMQAFVDNLAVALQQTRLFLQLAEQNDQIAMQKDTIQQRSDVIRDIVYALAHDLRTPISAAAITMVQALDGAYGELPERYRAILETSIASNYDVRRLVETLLLVARYESGEDSRAFVRQRVQGLVQQVADELHPVAQAKGVALHVALGIDAWVTVDGYEVRRALANLVANAIEATPVGGTILVQIESMNEMHRIWAIDDGYGVAEERREALFTRFGGTRAGAGTGLGLYIVRRIARKYGGEAGYEPREPRGSRFFIDLPGSGGSHE
ncbi:MAG: sensor histidine kinase [Vulcanimicrobiaceae bacterium]